MITVKLRPPFLSRCLFAALFLVCGTNPGHCDPSAQYNEGKRLRTAGSNTEARAVLEPALQEAAERNDHYYSFFFARDIANCHMKEGQQAYSLTLRRRRSATWKYWTARTPD